MRSGVIGTIALACLVSSSAAAAEVPRPLRPILSCMVRALQADTHFNHVRSGMKNVQLSLTEASALHAYVEYRTIGRDGSSGGARFYRMGESDFTAFLNGLFAGNDRGPDDWQTTRAADLWKTRCKVNASALYN